MEGELPPSGDDERLTPRASESVEPDTQRRLYIVRRSETPEQVDQARERTRETVEIYRRACGTPTELYDLSVGELAARRLARSCWAGVVDLSLTTPVHPSIVDRVEERLFGRDPEVEVRADELSIYFQMEDGTHPSRIQAAHFGYTLAILLGGLPRISVGQYRKSQGSNSRSKGDDSIT